MFEGGIVLCVQLTRPRALVVGDASPCLQVPERRAASGRLS